MERFFLRRLTPLGFILALLTTGQDSAYADPPEVTNLGLAGGAVAVSGNLVAFKVFESDTDLNGDGDTDDFVVHVYDATSGMITNLGLHTFGLLAFRDNILAIAVRESHQGNTDLNGDGDTLDDVLHVHDATSGITTNLSLGGTLQTGLPAVHSGRLLSFVIPEITHGNTDLNGDGDAVDVVVHVYDVRSGMVTNVGLCAGLPEVSATSVALLVNESCEGNTDLNGDGDTLDQVFHVYDAETGITTNFGLACGRIRASENLIAFSAIESDEDLNGDGDMSDGVVHVYDTKTKVASNLGLANSGLSVSGSLVTITVREDAQGNTDLNGDGDTLDRVLHVFDARSGITTNLVLASSFPSVSPNYVGFGVLESFGGGDLNDDGDTNDIVAHVYDATLGVVDNLGFALGDPNDPPNVGLNLCSFTVSERDQGNTDLNGDGDRNDRIGHIYDPVSGNFTNLGVDVFRSIDLKNIDGDSILFRRSEFIAGIDLNGDGDTSDVNVLHVHDATLGVTTNLRLTGPSLDLSQDSHVISFTVRESNQGNTDLNGDGDTNDSVLHVAGFPCGAGTVNSGMGSVVDVLRLNGNTRRVNVPVGQPITASFDPAPMGPSPSSYLLWVWAQGPSSPMTLSGVGQVLGCTSNPTPLHVGRNPQPFMCLRSPSLPSLVCQGVNEISGPAKVPWSRTRSTGFGQRRVLTLQGLVQDNGAANSTGYSVTNTVVLDVQ